MEVSLVNDILKLSLEESTVDGEMVHPTWKAQYSVDPGPFGFCGSDRLGCLRLVFDGVKHMVNGNPERNEVGLFQRHPCLCRACLWVAF